MNKKNANTAFDSDELESQNTLKDKITRFAAAGLIVLVGGLSIGKYVESTKVEAQSLPSIGHEQSIELNDQQEMQTILMGKKETINYIDAIAKTVDGTTTYVAPSGYTLDGNKAYKTETTFFIPAKTVNENGEEVYTVPEGCTLEKVNVIGDCFDTEGKKVVGKREIKLYIDATITDVGGINTISVPDGYTLEGKRGYKTVTEYCEPFSFVNADGETVEILPEGFTATTIEVARTEETQVLTR